METKQRNDKALHAAAFFLPIVAVFIGLAFGGFAPFGTKDVFTGCGMEQILSYYYELYDRLRSGAGLSYSLQSDTGYLFSSCFAYYLSDPINLICLIFPRTAIPAVFSLIYALKVGFAGLFFSYFLRAKKDVILAEKAKREALRADEIEALRTKALAKEEAKKAKSNKKDLVIGGSETPTTKLGIFLASFDLPILALSITYALSGFMFGFGLNPSFTSVAALLPLMILGLEALIQEKKWKLYLIATAASVLCSVYLALVAFIFVLFYFLFFDFCDFKSALEAFLRKFLCDLIVIGLTMFILLPAVSSTFFKENISSFFPFATTYCNFFDAFKQFLSNTIPSNGGLYGCGINIYCGIFSIFLFLLFLLNRNIRLVSKIRMGLFTILLFLGTFINTINFIFNGFHKEAYNQTAFGFGLIFMLLLIGYTVVLNSEHVFVRSIHVSAVSIVVLIVLALLLSFSYDSINPFITSFEVLFVFYFLILLYRSKSMTKLCFLVCFSLMMIVEITLSFTKGMGTLGNEIKAYSDTLTAKYYAVEEYIHSKDPSAKIYEYDTTKDSNPVLFMLSGYDYIITQENMRNVGILLTKEESYNGIDIYKNDAALHGFFTKESPEPYSLYQNNTLASYNLLSNEYLGGTDIFTTEGNFSLGSPGHSYDKNGMELKHDTEVLITGTVSEDGYYYRHFFKDQYIGNLKKDSPIDQYISLSLNSSQGDPLMYSSYKFDEEAFHELYQSLKKSSISFEKQGNQFLYNVKAEQDGFFTLDSGILKGITGVYVNGTKVTPTLFLETQLIVPVSAGDNTIEVVYTSNRILWGSILSVITLLILLFITCTKKETFVLPSFRQLITGVSGFLTENYTYCCVMLLSSLAFLFGMLLTQSAPFGNNMLLVGDSYIQDYMAYISSHNTLKESGLTLLDYSIGFSRTNTNALLHYLFNPLELLLDYLTPERFYLLRNILPKFLYIVFSGPALILYLTHRKKGRTMDKRDSRLIALGLCYSLSNFAIGFFIYNGFYFLVYVPLIILALERLVYEKKPLLYILLLIKIMDDAYYAFMLCEFLFLFFFTMEFTSIKDFFRKGIRFGISSIAAAGIRGIYLLTYFIQTRMSPYISDDAVLPSVTEIASPFKILQNFRTFTIPSIVIWDNSCANIYCGLLILLLFPLYLFTKEQSLSIRIRRMILSLVLFVGIIYEPLNYVLHGFHKQSGVPNRFAAFLIFLLLTFCYDIFLSIHEMKSWVIISALGLISILMFAAIFQTSFLSESSVLSMALLLILFIGTMILCIRKNKKALTIFYSLVLTIEVFCSGVFSFYNTVGTRGEDLLGSQTSLNRLADQNPDLKSDFTVTEYINNSVRNYSYLNSSESISAFCSDMTSHHMDLAAKWNIVNSANVIYYLTGNPLADLMLHVKYHVVDIYDQTASSEYELVSTVDNYELYENPNYLPFGVFFGENEALSTWDNSVIKDYNNSFEYQNAFANALGFDDLYTEIRLEDDPALIGEDVSYCYTDTSVLSQLETTDSVDMEVKIFTAKDVSGDIYLSGSKPIFYLGKAEQGKADEFNISFPVTKDSANFTFTIEVLNEDVYSAISDKLNQYTMSDVTRDFNGFSGTITAPEAGNVYLSLPFVTGWTAYVDGQETEITSFLGGMGIPVTAGTHTIELKYFPPALLPGACVTLISLFAVVLFFVIQHNRRRKNSCTAND